MPGLSLCSGRAPYRFSVPRPSGSGGLATGHRPIPGHDSQVVLIVPSDGRGQWSVLSSPFWAFTRPLWVVGCGWCVGDGRPAVLTPSCVLPAPTLRVSHGPNRLTCSPSVRREQVVRIGLSVFLRPRTRFLPCLQPYCRLILACRQSGSFAGILDRCAVCCLLLVVGCGLGVG